MKKILVLFCLLVSITASAESFKYMYGGPSNTDVMSYVRLNTQPVILNYLTELSAIQLIFEGDSLMFYIISTKEKGREIIVSTVTSDGRKTNFSITNEMTIFVLGDIGYVITDIPKNMW